MTTRSVSTRQWASRPSDIQHLHLFTMYRSDTPTRFTRSRAYADTFAFIMSRSASHSAPHTSPVSDALGIPEQRRHCLDPIVVPSCPKRLHVSRPSRPQCYHETRAVVPVTRYALSAENEQSHTHALWPVSVWDSSQLSARFQILTVRSADVVARYRTSGDMRHFSKYVLCADTV